MTQSPSHNLGFICNNRNAQKKATLFRQPLFILNAKNHEAYTGNPFT